MQRFETPLKLIDALAKTVLRFSTFKNKQIIAEGTGFAIRFDYKKGKKIACFVTNRHVFKEGNPDEVEFLISKKDKNGNLSLATPLRICIPDLQSKCIYHPDENIDLAIINVSFILNSLTERGEKVFLPFLEEKEIIPEGLLQNLQIMEEVLMIGAPGGHWDKINNMPLFRKGITSTHPNLCFNGEPYFLVDIASFGGSSGSPIYYIEDKLSDDQNVNIVYNPNPKAYLLGILYAGPQYGINGVVCKKTFLDQEKEYITESLIPMNLGMVIHSRKILDFKELLLK